MKKGLTLALMTVAVAMLGLQVMAMAPVVSDIPSPIVGAVAGTQATNSTPFVFKDAIDLRSYVTDTDTTSILWSYQVSGTSEYLINGVQPNPGTTTESLIQPGQYQINLAANVPAGELGSENNPNVITIRNKKYAPLTGTGASTAGLTGINAGDTEVITFVATDGTTYSAKHDGTGSEAEVFFYTDFSGSSRLSSQIPVSTPVTSISFPGTTNGFVMATTVSANTGKGITASTTNGLCFTVPTLRGVATENVSNLATYTSTWTAVPYVDQQLYRFRLTLIGGSSNVGNQVPFWDFIIQCESAEYSADVLIMDSWGHGNQNAVLNTAKTFDVYWTPSAVTTSGWNDPSTGAVKLDSNNSGKLLPMNETFRFIDSDANAAVASYLRYGTVCLQSMQVDRCDITAVQSTGPADWKIDPSTGANFANCLSGSGNYYSTASITGASKAFTLTPVTTPVKGLEITPPTDTTTNAFESLTILPGLDANAANAFSGTFGSQNPDTQADQNLMAEAYPVPWKANTLYRFQADMSAPTATDAANQVSAISLIFNTASAEMTGYSTITTLGGGWNTATNRNYPGPGMPKYGLTKNTYNAFFWSQTPTGGAVTGQSGYTHGVETYMDYIKPMVMFLNPGGTAWLYNGTTLGSTIISRLQVDEVTTPLAP
jgi:hypothetical protein